MLSDREFNLKIVASSGMLFVHVELENDILTVMSIDLLIKKIIYRFIDIYRKKLYTRR